MIKLKTTTKTLKELIAPLVCLVDECKLNITNEGIAIKVVNPQNTAMISVNYPSEQFEGFEVSENTLIGLELKPLLQAVKYNNPKEVIDIYTENINSAIGVESTMYIESDGFKDKISLIDPASVRKEPKVPELHLTGSCTLDTKRLVKILNKASYIEYIRIKIKDGKFVSESESHTKKTNSETSPDTITGFGSSLFDCKQLLSLCKIIKSKTVDIELGNDYPIIIKFNVNKSKVEYMLAPRVESQ